MKTVRTNTFETNSSSSHSFTIEKKKKEKDIIPSLFKDGVLYPKNLIHYAEKESYSETTLVAETKWEKLALIVQMVTTALESYTIYEYFNIIEIIEEVYDIKIDREFLPPEDLYDEFPNYFSNFEFYYDDGLIQLGLVDDGDYNLIFNEKDFKKFLTEYVDDDRFVMKHVTNDY